MSRSGIESWKWPIWAALPITLLSAANLESLITVVIAKELGQPMSALAAAIFGHERVIPDQSVLAEPITGEEIANEVAGYQAYASSFTREKAAQHLVS